MKKRILSILLCLAMVVGLFPSMAFAAEGDSATAFPYTYSAKNNRTAEKISHSQVEPNAKGKSQRTNDGIVNYIGDGQLDTQVDTANAPGCRGESYSWSALGHGDWIYTGLLYNALWTTTKLMGTSLGYKIDPDLLPAIMNTLYNGDYFMEEKDGGNPGGALVKINTKTGDVKILMSQDKTGQNVSFRNAVEYNHKFYFCGSVNGAPQIWQVDPETDECKYVYGMDIGEFGAGFKQGISAGIRGMCVYNNELIVSSVAIVGKNNDGTPKFGAQIYSTKTPEDRNSFKVIATQEQLFNYPAFHFADSIYGGSIWEIVEFNNKLYASICTGTEENKPDDYTMQSFALVCGEKQSNGTWRWHPVVGDKEKNKAKYTFGIDPERTCSGAGVLTVFKDHLYIAEYNDEEIAMIQLMFNFDFGFMNKNLEQSVNLYRMDKNEDIELVVGDKTELFPAGGTSGLKSGFGRNENQYFWRMTVYNDKLYCGTFDTSSLLQPIGQFVNGEMKNWTKDQWNSLFNYIRVLLKLTQDKYGVMPIEKTSKEAQVREDIRYLFDQIDAFTLDRDDPEANGSIDAESDLLAELFSSLPDTCFTDDSDKAENAITQTLEDTFSDDAETYARGDNVQDDMGVFPEFGSNDNVQDNMQVIPGLDQLNQMKKLAKSMQELIQLTKKIIVTAQYMSEADRGCDVYATADGKTFETITTDGFGDPFNHGLRVFAETNNGLGFGTANPFYGTQWWLIREDNTKPVEKAPKAPAATEILTSYIVRCVTENSGHESKTMDPLPGTLTIGEVKKDGNGYICPITISTKKYAEAYSVENGKHSAVKENITYNMTWDGIKWVDPGMNQMPTIDVKCTTSTSGGGNSGGGSGHSSSSSYSITVKESSNGAVTSSHKTAKSGTTITLTAAPEKNYVLDTLKAVDSKNNKIKLTEKDGKYTFSMLSSNVTVTATFKKNFTDVPNGSYFEEAVNWAVKKGITTGISDTLFDPDGICTRAQAVTFLWRAAGSPEAKTNTMLFTDVPAGSYYYDAVLWAVENGITMGTSETTFSPDMNCSRAQIVTFLWRSQKAPSASSTNPFTDVAAGTYYADAVLWAVKEDVTKGTSDTKFSPDANCTRAQIVTFIWRALSE